MTVQAVASLLILGLVIARAVNIFGSHSRPRQASAGRTSRPAGGPAQRAARAYSTCRGGIARRLDRDCRGAQVAGHRVGCRCRLLAADLARSGCVIRPDGAGRCRARRRSHGATRPVWLADGTQGKPARPARRGAAPQVLGRGLPAAAQSRRGRPRPAPSAVGGPGGRLTSALCGSATAAVSS